MTERGRVVRRVLGAWLLTAAALALVVVATSAVDPCGILQRRIIAHSVTLGDLVVAAQVDELPRAVCWRALIGGL